MSRLTRRLVLVALMAGTLDLVSAANAADTESDIERDARLARRGAGLRVGGWFVAAPDDANQVESTSSPMLEGYFQKGLDRHLAWVNNVGIWKRTQRYESSGGLTGETVTEKVDAYLVPMFTSLKFHPFTGPNRPLQPFLDGGAGFAVGIQNRSTEDSGGFGVVGSSSGTTTHVGFGFQFGTGLDWWLGSMFGVGGHVRYQWIHFTEDIGTERTFDGIALDVGFTYRFQY